MNLKKVKKMQLPSNCKCLSTHEMMQNESGWYINFNTGELFLTYRDIDSTVRWVTSFIEDVATAMTMDAGTVRSEITRSRSSYVAMQSESSAGIGIRINNEGFRFFSLSPEQVALANSNTFVF